MHVHNRRSVTFQSHVPSFSGKLARTKTIPFTMVRAGGFEMISRIFFGSEVNKNTE